MYKYTVCIHGVYTENILYIMYAESIYIYTRKLHRAISLELWSVIFLRVNIYYGHCGY